MTRWSLGVSIILTTAMSARAQTAPAGSQFTISFPASVHQRPITGRLFLMIGGTNEPEVRLQAGGFNSPPMFGLDVDQLKPGEAAVVNGAVLGYPLRSLAELPSGEYYVQALLNVYTEFRRADGHVIWAHMDQWEGQQFNRSPGNLYSKVHKLHLDASRGYSIPLSLTEVVPPVSVPAETEWVKRVKIQSPLLTKFWGRPMYLGAVVLLPRGYASHPDVQYPVIYQQGHFSHGAPLGFSTDRAAEREPVGRSGYDFYQEWRSDGFPRMVAVTFQHPTPYYDYSYGVNSANHGPYEDAIMTELIPYIEERFRIIRQPYARVLTGGSAGGLTSLALQLRHPDFFGGTWSFALAEIDFRRYYSVNIYDDDNAFVFQPAGRTAFPWLPSLERNIYRAVDGQPLVSVRQLSQLEAVLGSKGRGGLWFDPSAATYGPVGADGYPQPLIDKMTGTIDREVAKYWRDHGYDLRHYAETHWSKIGPQLVGKLHLYVGEMDEFYGNLGVYLFEDFLKKTKNPAYAGSVEYGRPLKGHGWHPMSNAELVRIMANHIATTAPPGVSRAWKSS